MKIIIILSTCFIASIASSQRITFEASSYICGDENNNFPIIIRKDGDKFSEITRNLSVNEADRDVYILGDDPTRQVWLTKESNKWVLRETKAGKVENEYLCWDAKLLVDGIANAISSKLYPDIEGILERNKQTILQQYNIIDVLNSDKKSYLEELNRANAKLLAQSKISGEKTKLARELRAELELNLRNLKAAEKQLQIYANKINKLENEKNSVKKSLTETEAKCSYFGDLSLENMGSRLKAALGRAETEERKRRDAEEKLRNLRASCATKPD